MPPRPRLRRSGCGARPVHQRHFLPGECYVVCRRPKRVLQCDYDGAAYTVPEGVHGDEYEESPLCTVPRRIRMPLGGCKRLLVLGLLVYWFIRGHMSKPLD
jgi:hypothetical protein